jgi:hypothetical protein
MPGGHGVVQIRMDDIMAENTLSEDAPIILKMKYNVANMKVGVNSFVVNAP